MKVVHKWAPFEWGALCSDATGFNASITKLSITHDNSAVTCKRCLKIMARDKEGK